MSNTHRPPSNAKSSTTPASPRPELSVLAVWLVSVIDGLADRIFGRAAWAEVLGVTPQAISQWLTGTGTPSPENLDELLTVLETDWTDVAAAELDRFAEIARRPLDEVVPRTKHAAQTLDHYRTVAHRDLFDRALGPLPPPLQRQVLRDGTATCHELVLHRRARKVGSTSTAVRVPGAASARPAPADEPALDPIIIQYGAEEVVRLQRKGSLFAIRW